MNLDAKIDREARFWDSRQAVHTARDPAEYMVRAADRTDRSVPWLPYLGFPAYVQCMLDRLGDVRGKRVLDLGSGTGFVAALLASNGAEVDAVDISEASLEVARWRARVSGVEDRIRFHLSPAETLPFETASFDAICGAFVLHHLDLTVAAPELRRVLHERGAAAFIETSGGSVLLMAARRFLTGRFGIERASSEDEAPLGPRSRAELEKVFGATVHIEYPDTLFFRMLSYVAPLHRPPAQAVLAFADRLMRKAPLLASQSYFCVVSIGSAADES